ncbi:MAG: protein kinase [Thermoanaerobaculia bacterium]
MTLASGTRLGPYEIAAPLGAGGMGEVYRAKDTRLGREVAIKVLPAAVASDPERVKRFEKEARAASALNHPNLVTLHDIGSSGGVEYIAMELVDGRTLREILADGVVATKRLLAIAAQVADGLARAHAAGIVHRDLKPENIMVTRDGLVKILDFGLAKLTQPEDLSGATQSPTVSGGTEPGLVMGTIGYMSPEQAVGKPLDFRSDQFALGSILYEMATGKRAFARGSAPETMAAIIRDEPEPIGSLSPLTPTPLRWIVERCLAKNPDDRYASTRDLARDLATLKDRLSETSGSGIAAASAAPRRSWRRALPWILAAGLAVALATRLLGPSGRGGPAPGPIRFAITLPESVGFRTGAIFTKTALSPDGQRLAFVGVTREGRKLLLRPLGSLESEPLEGTEGAQSPFWSPDGHFLGFFADGKLKRIDASGGPPQVICEASLETLPTWSPRGDILFSQLDGGKSGIYRIGADGGEPRLILKPDPARGEEETLWPQFLPDGTHFLYVTVGWSPRRRELRVGSLDSKETTGLTSAIESRAEYVRPGFLLYARQGALLAQPFDPESLRFRGDAVTLANRVHHFNGPANAGFSASQEGSVAYEAGPRNTKVAWFSRGGKELGTVGTPAPVGSVRLAPDGRTVAMHIADTKTGTSDIWLYELSRGVSVRMTLDPGDDTSPVWAADGRSFFFRSDRKGAPDILRATVGAPGSETELLALPGSQHPEDASPDGRILAYTELSRQTVGDLWLLPLVGDGKPTTLLRTRFHEEGSRFSPDGKWIAFSSDDSGSREVYVVSREGSGERIRVSVGGGALARWRRDGEELYYIAPGGSVMAVPLPLRGGGRLEPGQPTLLFRVEGVIVDWDAAADGQRFLIDIDTPDPAPISVLVNWPTLLKAN